MAARLLLPFPLLACVAAVQPTPAPATTPIADTKLDANCTEPRPSPTHECTQDCGPPVANAADPPRAWRWLSAEDAASRRQYGCPICLPEDTSIATPDGARPITALVTGDPIWTLDRAGRRVAGRVVHVGATPVSGGHELIQLSLADGRVLRASAGHPDVAGVALGTARVGAAMSGSTITAIDRVPYSGSHTHDVLPSGSTGVYWADGVAVRSSFAGGREPNP